MSLRGYALRCGVTAITIASLILQTGCKVSATASVSVNTQTGATTVGGGVTVSSNIVTSNLAPSDLHTSPPSSFTIIASVPGSNYSANASSPTQATFTAVTDNGYTATTTVDLQPVTSTTSPVNSGDLVYTYAVPNSPALNTWIQNVASNTTSTFTLTSATTIPLLSAGNAGNYTISVQINSNSTGVLDEGSASARLSGPQPDPCPTGRAICEPKG